MRPSSSSPTSRSSSSSEKASGHTARKAERCSSSITLLCRGVAALPALWTKMPCGASNDARRWMKLRVRGTRDVREGSRHGSCMRATKTASNCPCAPGNHCNASWITSSVRGSSRASAWSGNQRRVTATRAASISTTTSCCTRENFRAKLARPPVPPPSTSTRRAWRPSRFSAGNTIASCWYAEKRPSTVSPLSLRMRQCS
mmetsp:Transcript_4488/g.13960  ORF Transcript_4488/g.13960 Transcript_4488/m.13960 type:complete len:201 (-) Transcript_4488:125-727(-)